MPRAKLTIRSHLRILGSVNVQNNLEMARASRHNKRVPTGSRGALVGTLCVFISELAHGKGVRLAGYFSRVIRLRSLS